MTPSQAAPDPGASPSIGAVDRAVDVLMLFGRTVQPSLGVTEIAHELGLPKSGVHRILRTLTRRRLITYDAGTRKYALGQAAVSLSQGYAARHDMQSMAAQALTALMRATGETATLAIRRHATVLYRAQAVAEHELRLEQQLAAPFPLHVGASGKAFLAFLPDAEIDEHLASAFAPPASLPGSAVPGSGVVDRLRNDLRASRARGWAASEGERLVGVSSIAAPVVDLDGSPMSVLAVSAPSARMAADDTGIAATVLEAARHLSEQMGYVDR